MANTDTNERRLEICKIHQPKPILITSKEADGVEAVEAAYLVWLGIGWQARMSIFIFVTEVQSFLPSMMYTTRQLWTLYKD